MKSILLFSITLLLAFPLHAQPERHEASAGIGFASRPYLKEIIKTDRIGGAGYGGDDNSSTPAFHIQYRHLLHSRFRAGATFIFEEQKHSLTGSVPPFDNYSRYTDRYYTLLLHGDYTGARSSFIRLYSGLSAGTSMRKREERLVRYGLIVNASDWRFACQVNPIGIRVGKQFGAFAELGYGYKGIFCAGLSYHF